MGGKDRLIERIFALTGVSDFLVAAQTMGKGAEVNPANPFAPKTDLNEAQKKFWQTFALGEYQQGLNKQFQKHFSPQELQRVAQFYTSPFRTKILVTLNTEASLVGFHNNKSETYSEVELSKNKITLIQSIINLHKVNPLLEDQKEKLKSEIRRARKLLEILSYGTGGNLKEDLEKNEVFLRDFEIRAIRFFGKAFEQVRESELRELVRVMTDPKVQDAAQLIISYHYYFLEKHLESLTNSQSKSE